MKHLKPRIKFDKVFNLYQCRGNKTIFSIYHGYGKTPVEAYYNFINRKPYTGNIRSLLELVD